MLKKLIQHVTLTLMEINFARRVVGHLAYQKKRVERRFIEARLRSEGLYGDEVIAGPFKGMVYPPAEMWASCRFEKLCGFYEPEWHAWIEKVAKEPRPYSSIINVGAAEGYFVVGFARLFPGCKVWAFEGDQVKTGVLEELAKVNGVTENIEIAGFCTPEELTALDVGDYPLLICDVDGYEQTLVDADKVPWLKRADIALELHDAPRFAPGIRKLIRERFEQSHHIDEIFMTGIDYHQYPALRNLSMLEIEAMTSSDRPMLQSWYLMEPRERD